MIMHEQSLAWSLISPNPVPFYDEDSMEWFVYWNGILMLNEHAMILVATNLLNAHPTPEMKRVAYEKFVRLYYAGAFKTRAWDGLVGDRIKNFGGDILQYYQKVLGEHITTTLTDKVKPSEVLFWFEKTWS